MSVNLNICMEFKIVSHFYIIQELSIDLFLYQALFNILCNELIFVI